jgi:D-alanyl-lipoteichoic acid acyltransferase DltB (MBOAT superfamily)
MLFNSIQFLIFFPVIATIYFLLPHRYRWLLLLVGSYYFYMSWKPEYIILILASTLIDYSVGLKLGSESRPAIRRRWLLLSLVTNLGLLFSFKYFNFFNDSFRQLFQMANLSYPVPALNVLLPVGISFYTFQTLSYTIDVYRGKIQPERHLGVFALFVSFFPQLVAGPIERSGNLLPQFYQKTAVDYERIISGLQRMTWGFFKKVVIADRLALLVNTVYNHPTEFSGMPLIIATYAFGFQIYCDFSAYSDIAIGAARVMGFDLMENFRQPYYARSIPEFWRRWHISLSTWFRDYVYLPLGGNRVKLPHWVFNILVVFVVSGLWHGANWTFVIWGALHGLYMVGTILGQQVWAKIGKPVKLPSAVLAILKIFITFNLVSFAWIFFRANSLADATYIATHLFSNFELRISLYGTMPGGVFEFAIALLAILLMELVHWLQMTKGSIRHIISSQPVWFRWSVYYALVLLIIMFGNFGLTEFIYFQF